MNNISIRYQADKIRKYLQRLAALTSGNLEELADAIHGSGGSTELAADLRSYAAALDTDAEAYSSMVPGSD